MVRRLVKLIAANYALERIISNFVKNVLMCGMFYALLFVVFADNSYQITIDPKPYSTAQECYQESAQVLQAVLPHVAAAFIDCSLFPAYSI